jgi:SAM-dependent methyltransferase
MVFNWGRCAKRSGAVEMLESHGVSDADLSRLYDYIEGPVGRWGSHRVILSFLRSCARRWEAGAAITILDLRCGRGGLARSIADWARSHKVDIRLLAVDKCSRIIHLARNRQRSYPEIVFDVRDLTDPAFLQAQQFDYVVSDSSLHRESDERALLLLKTMNRLAKRGIIAVDWVRDVRALALVGPLAGLYKNEAVSHDARLAIERGFTPKELRKLAKAAGVEYAAVRRQWGFRFSIEGERALVMSAEASPLRGLAGI